MRTLKGDASIYTNVGAYYKILWCAAKLDIDIADDIVILNPGRVAVVSTAAALKADGVDLRQHLGVF